MMKKCTDHSSRCFLIFLKEQIKIRLMQNVHKGFCSYYGSLFCNAKMFVSIFIVRVVLLFFSSFLNTKQVNIKIKIQEILSTSYFLKVRSVSRGWINSIRFEWWENAKWGGFQP